MSGTVNVNPGVKVKPEPQENKVEYDVFPLKAYTEEELDETRYHLLKFHSVKKIDPSKDFVQPTRLHRKDPKNLQFQMSLKELEQKKKDDEEKAKEQKIKREQYIEKTGKQGLTDEQIDEQIEVEGLDERERKLYEEKKKKEDELKEKEEERERQMQLVAPDGGARKQKKQIFKKRTKQVKVYNEAKRKLRYEEFYPWVLEDYDADQAWVGNYEAGLNDNYCLLVLDNVNNCFKLAPVEKFYKFTSRNKYATLTLEEAEAKMKQGSSGQRWLMRKMLDEATSGKRVDLRYRKIAKPSGNVEGDDDDKRSDEDEDLDYDDEFQDDEEAPIMEGPDEEKKLIESKMKREMLSANNLIEKVPVDEEDEDDLDELFEVKKEDKESKKLRKALSRNAMNEVYASDDEEEENPYLSESELESESEKSDKENDDNEIKVKKEDEEEGADIKVKTEATDNEDALLSPKKKKSKSKSNIYVDTYRSGFIKIKATKQILSQFLKGEWNPRTAIRRDLLEESMDTTTDELSANPNKLTRADIDALLVNGPIDLSVLVKSLRAKMQRDPNSKNDLKELLKESFVLKNKQVHHKEL
jgi:transcription initiation factor TFIIF subunit alpha